MGVDVTRFLRKQRGTRILHLRTKFSYKKRASLKFKYCWKNIAHIIINNDYIVHIVMTLWLINLSVIWQKGVKSNRFFEKFGVLCFLLTNVLRFVLLPYYQQNVNSESVPSVKNEPEWLVQKYIMLPNGAADRKIVCKIC